MRLHGKHYQNLPEQEKSQYKTRAMAAKGQAYEHKAARLSELGDELEEAHDRSRDTSHYCD
eukprot:6481406-Amphidinium_carterae.3